MLYIDGKSTFAYLWLFVVLSLGWAKDVSSNSETTGTIRQRRMTTAASFCFGPSQPTNGLWKLHRRYCDQDTHCDIPEDFPIQSGNEIVYNCDPGYKIEGNNEVYCTDDGSWSATPRCGEIKCDSLNSVSRTMTCYNSETGADCDSSVLPGTQAQVFCRPGYKKDTILLLEQGETVTCNKNGKWEPDPIRCEPACGVTITHQTELVVGGKRANIIDVPWHATIYFQRNTDQGKEKEPLCGATIIRANLLLTSAHCVYDEEEERIENPRNLFVMTGAIQRDYDSQLHDLQTVRKSAVKNIHTHCNYTGRVGNNAWDIAILELQQPFMLSSILLPACLDLLGYSDRVLEVGAYGTIAGFGKTAKNDVSDSLQTIKVPYISYGQCQPFLEDSGFKGPVPKDMFCGGQLNGSSVQYGDTGGGLMFKKNDEAYVMGILSTGLEIEKETAQRTSSKNTPSLYTKVSYHMPWILNVIFNMERYGSHPPCSRDVPPLDTTPTSPRLNDSMTNSGVGEISCPVPPPPENGKWRLHGHVCANAADCTIPKNTLLKPGNKLHYSCAAGYKVTGNTEVHCETTGEWSGIPICVEIKCSQLNTVSTSASCFHSSRRVNCDFPVPPGTQAKVSCHPAYREETAFTPNRRTVVNCATNGEWEPEPIKCLPVCGITATPQSPHAIGGRPANINEFPWHASIYVQKNSLNTNTKELTCGATIIHTNFLLTAAHCVYYSNTKSTENPRNIFILAGNIFRNYDLSVKNSEVVKNARVKTVHVNPYYHGLEGNYFADIALLELEKPFVFTKILSPACVEIDGYSEQILETGAEGRVAGFGRTSDAPTSGVLQTLTVPYVTYRQCQNSTGAERNEYLISTDKFCAGYTNGTAVCDGDSGGGLVFKKDNLWHVMGIVSVGLGIDFKNSQPTCDRNSYTLYTKVSEYLDWIKDTISRGESSHDSAFTTRR